MPVDLSHRHVRRRPTNPYDPGTPAAQQAKATVRGLVALPPGYTPERLTGGVVDLFAAADATEPAQQVALTAEAGDLVTAPLTFEGVVAGRYTVQARVEDFGVAPADSDAIAGRTDLCLRPIDGTVPPAVVAGNVAELVSSRRNNLDQVATTMWRTAAFNGQPAVPALGSPRAGSRSGMKPSAILTMESAEGIQILLVSGSPTKPHAS